MLSVLGINRWRMMQIREEILSSVPIFSKLEFFIYIQL